MEKRRFRTAAGEIHVRGEIGRFDARRPLVFLIAGSYAAERRYDGLIKSHPDADVLLAHLPGNHCPKLATTSIEAFGAAFDEALNRIGRPAVVVGISVGGVVALALRSPFVRAILAVDPSLDTSELWPLRAKFRANGARDADVAEFALDILGIGPDFVVPHDYTALLEGVTVPAICLAGDMDLMPERATPVTPSLMSEAARAAVRSRPNIELEIVPGVGHDIARFKGDHVLAALHRLLAAVSR